MFDAMALHPVFVFDHSAQLPLIDLDLLFDGDIDLSRHSFNNYFVPLVVLLDRLTYLYSSVHS